MRRYVRLFLSRTFRALSLLVVSQRAAVDHSNDEVSKSVDILDSQHLNEGISTLGTGYCDNDKEDIG